VVFCWPDEAVPDEGRCCGEDAVPEVEPVEGWLPDAVPDVEPEPVDWVEVAAPPEEPAEPEFMGIVLDPPDVPPEAPPDAPPEVPDEVDGDAEPPEAPLEPEELDWAKPTATLRDRAATAAVLKRP